VVKRDEIT
jgi:hypothetical protein